MSTLCYTCMRPTQFCVCVTSSVEDAPTVPIPVVAA